MWDQMKGVQAKIQSFVDSAPDGVHMICYSQGIVHACIYREAVIATCHNVRSVRHLPVYIKVVTKDPITTYRNIQTY